MTTSRIRTWQWGLVESISRSVSYGLRLNNEVLRIAVGLRLGLPLCEELPLPMFSKRLIVPVCMASHAITAEGKMARHQMINDIIHRSLSAAGVPSIKEPCDLSKRNRKRFDGLTIVPWKSGRALAWDVTVADTFAPSYLNGTTHTPGWAFRGGRQQLVHWNTPSSRIHAISSRSHSRPWGRCVRQGMI